MIPRLTDGGPVVCLAPGPSLTTEDCDYVHGCQVPVIAINDAVRLAPWADVLYSSDKGWWHRHKLGKDFAGLRVKVCNAPWKPTDRSIYPRVEGGIVILKNSGTEGVDFAPNALRNLQNSGGAAINLAVHLGAGLIVLVGYDMAIRKGRAHFHDQEPTPVRSPYIHFRRLIGTMAKPLRAAGIEVVNCSRQTDLECFPCRPLREVLGADRRHVQVEAAEAGLSLDVHG